MGRRSSDSGRDFPSLRKLICFDKRRSPHTMEATVVCQECAAPIISDSARSCIQCTKAFCQPCVNQGPGFLGGTCSLECLEQFEDSISGASPGGQVFITGMASSDGSKRLGLRVGLDRQTFQEPYCARRLRRDFAKECDPGVSPFLAGGQQYPCFDNYFQAGKVLKEINPTYTQQWFQTNPAGAGDYPLSPGRSRIVESWHLCSGSCRSRVYYCSCAHHTEATAYTDVLVPAYIQLLREAPVMQLLCDQLARGRDVLLYDSAYTPTSPIGCDLVTSEAVEAARSTHHDPVPYGLLVAGELLGLGSVP